jgi:hypothetical protein
MNQGLTAPQLAHLRAAEAGDLVANWHNPAVPIRRWVRTGTKASKVVCEALLDQGRIRLAPQPQQAVIYAAELTDAGRAALAAAGGAQ